MNDTGKVVHLQCMPQLHLPIFSVGTTAITAELAFERRDNQVVYFNGQLPVFTHEVTDVPSFRLYTTQLIVNGTASQGEIVKAFGISPTTVKRCVKRYRDGGPRVFFTPPRKRQGHRLTPERLEEAQALLDQGERIPTVSTQVGVLQTTRHKAVGSGRLRRLEKKSRRIPPPMA